jgi:hypothetical protein
MLKCSFCEQPLVCKSCGQPFQSRRAETHVGVYQPDMQIYCPECEKLLVCKACGYIYGESEGETEDLS